MNRATAEALWALGKEYPGVVVHTFAYVQTMTPPLKTIKAEPNVIVQLCTSAVCFTHPLTECTDAVMSNAKTELDFTDVLAGWHETCDYLMLWDYTVNFCGYAGTWPNFGALCANVYAPVAKRAVFLFQPLYLLRQFTILDVNSFFGNR